MNQWHERIQERDPRFAAVLAADPRLWPCRAADPEFRDGTLTLHFRNRMALDRASDLRPQLEAAVARVHGPELRVSLEMLK